MSSFLGISIDGIDGLSTWAERLPIEAADAGTESADAYLVEALREYPPYSYIPISAVGGFVSDRQRRYVMSQIRAGNIKPGQDNRTQRLAQGWQTIGAGRNQIVVNEVPYGVYEHDPALQTKMHMLQGWQTLPDFIRNKMDEIVAAFTEGVYKTR